MADDTTEVVEDSLEQIIRQLNVMGNDKEVESALVLGLANTHRTLQQSFFRSVIVPSIKFFATCDTDLRNEQASKTAKELMPIIEDAYFPHV